MKRNVAKFFERVDKFSAWNVWRIREDGEVQRYDHAMRWWESAQPDFDLNDPKASRQISVERVTSLKKISI